MLESSFYSMVTRLNVAWYKVISVPEWCPCSVRPMLVASGCSRIVVRGRALFVVVGVCTGIAFASCHS